MTKDELWKAFCARNPQFLTTGANFTATGLKKFFDQVWAQAQLEAVKTGETVQGYFGRIFGGNYDQG